MSDTPEGMHLLPTDIDADLRVGGLPPARAPECVCRKRSSECGEVTSADMWPCSSLQAEVESLRARLEALTEAASAARFALSEAKGYAKRLAPPESSAFYEATSKRLGDALRGPVDE